MVVTPRVKILSHISHVYSYITLSFPVLYMCGLVPSPGALKPSVGDGTESSWPLINTSFLCYPLFFLSVGSYLHLFSGVYANNNNNNNLLLWLLLLINPVYCSILCTQVDRISLVSN